MEAVGFSFLTTNRWRCNRSIKELVFFGGKKGLPIYNYEIVPSSSIGVPVFVFIDYFLA